MAGGRFLTGKNGPGIRFLADDTGGLRRVYEPGLSNLDTRSDLIKPDIGTCFATELAAREIGCCGPKTQSLEGSNQKTPQEEPTKLENPLSLILLNAIDQLCRGSLSDRADAI